MNTHILTNTGTRKPNAQKPRKHVLGKSAPEASPQSRLSLSRHYLATLTLPDIKKLTDVKGFSSALQPILEKESVQCLGQVNHEFPNESFTVVVALAESHISVHTWPEYRTVQLDVFLCNYIHDNKQKSERIFNAIVEYFEPVESDATYIDRL
ncbi:MAG TPA: S-adenosylmethionine decarboxylase [Candidatus Limnocylindria bacterium]|nr:S-adenosylmethionine decarboxylase [Candidatus Limnocylindria bacterium]